MRNSLNNFHDDPDYGDYLRDQQKDRRAEELHSQEARKTFWSELSITTSNTGEHVVWHKDRFIGSYQSLRSAQSKVEDFHQELCK